MRDFSHAVVEAESLKIYSEKMETKESINSIAPAPVQKLRRRPVLQLKNNQTETERE